MDWKKIQYLREVEGSLWADVWNLSGLCAGAYMRGREPPASFAQAPPMAVFFFWTQLPTSSVQHYRELWAGLWLIVLSIEYLRHFSSMDAAP